MATTTQSFRDRGYEITVKKEKVKNQEFVTEEQKQLRSRKTGERITEIRRSGNRNVAVTETQALKEQGKSTVVSGYAGQFTQPEARKLSEYTSQVGRIEILQRQQGGYIVGASSLERLRRGSEQEQQLKGWTSAELISGKKVVTSERIVIPPRTVVYDTSGSVPAEAVFKGGRVGISNDYGFVGGSGAGGFGAPSKSATFLDFNKYVPYAVFGILGTKKSRQEGKEAVTNVGETFGILPGARILYSTGVPVRKLLGAPSIEGLEPRRGDVLKAGLVPATFYLGGLKVGGVAISEYNAVRYGVAGLGIYGADETISKDRSLSGFIEGGTYGAVGLAAVPKYNVVTRNLMKLSPKYRGVEATGISYVESTTVPITLKNLLRFENTEISTIHVTTAKLPGSFVTTAMPEGAGGLRLRENLLNFYRSAPSSSGEPFAYLGYAGITDGSVSSSSGRVLFGTPKITLLTEKLLVTPSPRAGTLSATNILQVKQGGKSFIPAENLFGASTERQVVTVSKYGDLLPVKTEGSLVTTFPGERTFTFYPQRKANVLTRAVNFFRKEPLSEDTALFKSLSTSRYYKLDILPAKTTSITPGVESLTSTRNVPRLDLAEYNLGLQSSAASTRSVASSRFPGSFSGSSLRTESPSMISSGKSVPSSYSLTSSRTFTSSVSSTGVSSSFVISSTPSIFSEPSTGRSVSSTGSYSSLVSIPSSGGKSFYSGVTSFRSSGVPRDYFYSSPVVSSKKSMGDDFFGSGKVKSRKSKRRKLGIPSVYVLPDLASVSFTEAASYRRFGGGEAIAPRLTKDIYAKSLSAFKGYGTGFIPTEQMRTRRLKL